MPAYDFECDNCGRVDELTLPMAERHDPWPCTCGGVMKRVISAVPHYWHDCEQPGGYRPKGTPSE